MGCYEEVNGAQGRDRTTDTVIFSHVLYQLSYLGAEPRRNGGAARRAVYRGSSAGCLVNAKALSLQAVLPNSAVIPDSPKG